LLPWTDNSRRGKSKGETSLLVILWHDLCRPMKTTLRPSRLWKCIKLNTKLLWLLRAICLGGKGHNSYLWRHQIFMSEWHSHVTRNGVSSNHPCRDISGKWEMWLTIIWYYINHLYVSRNLEIHSILYDFFLMVCDITQRLFIV
jgi:hypothetical protein